VHSSIRPGVGCALSPEAVQFRELEFDHFGQLVGRPERSLGHGTGSRQDGSTVRATSLAAFRAAVAPRIAAVNAA
jgi:hypothetical protein